MSCDNRAHSSLCLSYSAYNSFLSFFPLLLSSPLIPLFLPSFLLYLSLCPLSSNVQRQVIEQMISEQESLLNPHQPEQQNQPFRKPPPQPHTRTTSQKPFGEEVSDKILPQGKEGVGASDAHSSLTDTSTLTADLETMEEEYIIRPQPSQAFEALDGTHTHSHAVYTILVSDVTPSSWLTLSLLPPV